MLKWFTGHGEGHHRPDLALKAVGGRARVVSSVAARHLEELEQAVPLAQVRRQLSSVCRGRQRGQLSGLRQPLI